MVDLRQHKECGSITGHGTLIMTVDIPLGCPAMYAIIKRIEALGIRQ